MLVTVPDPERRLRRVRLVQELWRPRLGPDFARVGDNGAWELRLAPPPVDRIEYQLEVTDAAGGVEVVCDPANPSRARGPFGEKSVLELPGYRPPAWLDSAPPRRAQTVDVPSRTLGADVPVTVWSPRGARTRRPLPLLVAHDWPEYAEYSGLLRFLAAGWAAGTIPPLRAALVPPVERNRDYSASARYPRALAREFFPRLEPVAPTEGGANGRAGMGTSLGALAMLHAHRLYAGSPGATPWSRTSASFSAGCGRRAPGGLAALAGNRRRRPRGRVRSLGPPPSRLPERAGKRDRLGGAGNGRCDRRAGEGHSRRDRPLGPRRPARLALLASPARPSPASVLLRWHSGI